MYRAFSRQIKIKKTTTKKCKDGFSPLNNTPPFNSTLDVFALGDLRSYHLREVYCWKYYLSIISTHRSHFLFPSVKQIS